MNLCVYCHHPIKKGDAMGVLISLLNTDLWVPGRIHTGCYTKAYEEAKVMQKETK